MPKAKRTKRKFVVVDWSGAVDKRSYIEVHEVSKADKVISVPLVVHVDNTGKITVCREDDVLFVVDVVL